MDYEESVAFTVQDHSRKFDRKLEALTKLVGFAIND